MPQHLSVNQVCEVLRAAFAPLQCGAEELPYGTGVRFRVFDPEGNGLVNWESIPAATAGDSRELKAIIDLTRERVTARGFQLEPWAFPSGKRPELGAGS